MGGVLYFIRRKIKLIQEDLSELDNLAHYSFEEITKDHIKFLAVERLLEKIKLSRSHLLAIRSNNLLRNNFIQSFNYLGQFLLGCSANEFSDSLYR